MANKPMLALLIPMLWSAVLVLPAFGAQAGAVLTSLYSFTGTNDGANPYAGLVQGSDGYFYGTTSGGGTNKHGTIFKISTNGVLTSLYSFAVYDGAGPASGLVQASDGNFYGTTSGNGNSYLDSSSVFQISTNGNLTTLYSFHGEVESFHYQPLPANNDGASPRAGLVQGSDGNFYGTTYYGGTNGLYTTAESTISYGTVFQINTNGAETILDSLSILTGDHPEAGLVQGSDGNFYGTTTSDGYAPPSYSGGAGSVFQISTNGTLNILYSFTGGNDGGKPVAGLLQGSDGNFYGTTQSGGNTNLNSGIGYGTVFKVTTNGTLTTLYSFSGTNDGGNPVAGLVQGSGGSFYGTTYNGGSAFSPGGNPGYGTVFQITATGVFTTLYSFTGGNDGATPFAELVQGSDGSFYGTTHVGGTNNLGTVFRLTIVPPQLAIVPAGANVILSWPTNYIGFTAGFTLKFATNLASPTVWQTNSTAPIVIGGQNVIISPISGSQMFFRLH
jgi:uncharacterized repeat protein (TIGR03803 family)